MKRMMIGCISSFLASIVDSFDRANSTNSLGSTDTGQAWTNSVIYGNAIGISSNAAYSAANVRCAAVVETGNASGSITFVVGTYADYIGQTFRYTDSNNYCIGQFFTSIGKFWVEGKLSGTSFGASNIAGYFLTGVTLANGDTVKITMSGTTITLYVNGTSKGSLTIAQNATATKHGITMNGTTARISSFRFDQ